MKGNVSRLAAPLFLGLLALCGCGRIPVENHLPVAVPEEATAALIAAARAPGRRIVRVEYRVWYHPNDRAVGVVRYADEDRGETVIRRLRDFSNPNWPPRFDTNQGVAEYPKLLAVPASSWKPCCDLITEITWHRFTVGGERLEVTLGRGVDRGLAAELLEALRGAIEEKHDYVRGHRLADAAMLEVDSHPEGKEAQWTVWFRSEGLSGSGIVFARRNGRLVVEGIAHWVS